ncbi:FAD binding domain-containing protein [Apiospora kogelbergensis]|uniref:FAD binding domain-containing protein n=1 Tax=Apiospora kogelbergensis TaxID=1337665 RepID=UPI00312E9F1E
MVAFRVLCFSIGTAVSAVFAQSTELADCKCFPGDPCWPSEADWASFNRTVGGRLVATVPLAAPCHDSAFGPYNESACAALRSTWWFPETHLSSSSSPMAPYFANASCDPFAAPHAQCVRGTDPQYAVRAAGAADYHATLAFAAARRLRLVIRNTGHDYNGKSTGAGALALWTHHLKDTAVVDAYESAHYRGPALRLGAGVQAHEAYVAAHAAGLAVVGGACATVGLAGGYSQGAGHGPLNSYAGLGADQILEWEVVTAAGDQLTASPVENSDLYWALAGGGGGTYAAVVSATVRAHRLRVVSVANLTFSAAGLSKDVYYDAVRTYISSLPAMTRAGTWHNWVLLADSFSLHPTVGPEMEASDLDALMQPTLAFLNRSGIPYG